MNMASDKKNLYIICPGSVSGDLWHLTAAQILHSRYGNLNHSKLSGCNLVTVVAVSEKLVRTGEQQEEQKKEYEQGEVTFNYLKHIGLDCLLVVVRGQDPGKKNLEQALYIQEGITLDEIYTQQKKQPADEFALVWKYAKRIDVSELPPVPKFPAENSRILQLMVATTIAIQYLYPEATRKERLENLGPRMSVVSKDFPGKQDEFQRDMEARKNVLESLPNFTRPVVFENYRKGPANSQTDSNPDLSHEFAQLAGEKSLKVIQINAGQGSDTTGMFDLYNKNGIPKPYPGLDPVAQVLFWLQIAKEKKDYYGIYGGRSGSIDLAAFCGVKCFFWDEPWLEYAVGSKNAIASLGTVGRIKSLDGQIPQCLRSMGLYPIMSIGYPILVSIDEQPIKNWSRIGQSVLGSWLDKSHEKQIYPPAPSRTGWIV